MANLIFLNAWKMIKNNKKRRLNVEKIIMLNIAK